MFHRGGVFGIVGGHPSGSQLFDAVVRLGGCSGVVVGPRQILTSAHCIAGAIAPIAIGKELLSISDCQRHPGYRPGSAQDDIGLCRLQRPTSVAPIALDEGPALVTGESVTLAGFGATSPVGDGARSLGVVETVVARDQAEGSLSAGTAQATACRGDSGGPVLVDRGGNLRVAAVIHGTDDVICGSAAEVAPVLTHLEWLSSVMDVEHEVRDAGHGGRSLATTTAALMILLCIALSWRVARAKRERGSELTRPGVDRKN